MMGLLWPWIWDPDGPAHGMYHPKGTWNFGRNMNQKAIELVNAGRAETDFEKRAKIYHELERVIHENYEDIFISWDIAILVYSKNVKGYNNAMDIDYRQGYYFSHPLWFKDGKN